MMKWFPLCISHMKGPKCSYTPKPRPGNCYWPDQKDVSLGLINPGLSKLNYNNNWSMW